MQRAMRTIRDVRGPGRYWGPLVYVAVDFDPPSNFCDLYEVEIWRRRRIDTSVLDEKIRERPFTGGDGRERTKTAQWSKIHGFDPEFARRWQRVVFLDAGLRVFHDLAPVFEHPWKGSIVAHSEDPKRFGSQLEARANPEALGQLVELVRAAGHVKGDLLDEAFFLNCFWIYDTALNGGVHQGLRELMESFPIFRTNEMGAMNVYFQMLRHLWRPLQINRLRSDGRPQLFDWSETGTRTWRDYVMLKYPTTINFEDT